MGRECCEGAAGVAEDVSEGSLSVEADGADWADSIPAVK